MTKGLIFFLTIGFFTTALIPEGAQSQAASVPFEDCNTNNIPDVCEVGWWYPPPEGIDCEATCQQQGSSACWGGADYCNYNGIPDECDEDTDGDGVVWGCDECPNDPNKTWWDICGCNVPEVDTDRDGFLDCEEECSSDPLKYYAGICGCGVPDVDSDNDGEMDCVDRCPQDPDNTRDADGDGTPDCLELCPQDPNKQSPLQCGCGEFETDTDGDGTADCRDFCVLDPLKVNQGTCGCGVPDDDTDGDKVPDCIDACPKDGLKISSGACGCNVSDRDSDFDGVADCNDACPYDYQKRMPGVCGCGRSDQDLNSNAIPDCLIASEFRYSLRQIEQGLLRYEEINPARDFRDLATLSNLMRTHLQRMKLQSGNSALKATMVSHLSLSVLRRDLKQVSNAVNSFLRCSRAPCNRQVTKALRAIRALNKKLSFLRW